MAGASVRYARRGFRRNWRPSRTGRTLIVMHHPPLPVGIGWMDPMVDEPWILRFREAIGGAWPDPRDPLWVISTGLLSAPFDGRTLVVCPATAVQLGLDLRPIDPGRAGWSRDDHPRSLLLCLASLA